MRGLLLLLLAIASRLTAAEGDGAADRLVELRVKPSLCIVDRQTPQCDTSFHVTWQSERSGYYCLSNDFVTAPLRCWTEERAGQLTEARVVDQEFRYWISEDGSNEPLADAKVEVLRVDEGDRRRSRRARHVWSIL